MSFNKYNLRDVSEVSVSGSVVQKSFVLNEDEFKESLLSFFKNGLKQSFQRRQLDQSELIRRSWVRFLPHMSNVKNEENYIEMLFSVFEIFPFTEYKLIQEALERFVLMKVYKYRLMKLEITRGLPIIEAPVNFIHYYVDLLQEDMYSANTYCSPALLLDFSLTKRIVRYGAQFKINHLNAQFCMNTILGVLT